MKRRRWVTSDCNWAWCLLALGTLGLQLVAAQRRSGDEADVAELTLQITDKLSVQQKAAVIALPEVASVVSSAAVSEVSSEALKAGTKRSRRKRQRKQRKKRTRSAKKRNKPRKRRAAKKRNRGKRSANKGRKSKRGNGKKSRKSAKKRSKSNGKKRKNKKKGKSKNKNKKKPGKKGRKAGKKKDKAGKKQGKAKRNKQSAKRDAGNKPKDETGNKGADGSGGASDDQNNGDRDTNRRVNANGSGAPTNTPDRTGDTRRQQGQNGGRDDTSKRLPNGNGSPSRISNAGANGNGNQDNENRNGGGPSDSPTRVSNDNSQRRNVPRPAGPLVDDVAANGARTQGPRADLNGNGERQRPNGNLNGERQRPNDAGNGEGQEGRNGDLPNNTDGIVQLAAAPATVNNALPQNDQPPNAPSEGLWDSAKRRISEAKERISNEFKSKAKDVADWCKKSGDQGGTRCDARPIRATWAAIQKVFYGANNCDEKCKYYDKRKGGNCKDDSNPDISTWCPVKGQRCVCFD